VDHIDGDWTNNKRDGSNYQTLCHPCHVKKTSRERKARNLRSDPDRVAMLRAAGIEPDEEW